VLLFTCWALGQASLPAPAADPLPKAGIPEAATATAANTPPDDELSRFKAGDGVVWNSKTHPKAHGYGVQLRHPRSWKAAEGDGTNVVQKFVSRGGAGSEVVIVSIRPLGMPPGQQLTFDDALSGLAPERARNQLPHGATLLSHQRTRLDGELCARLEYEVATPTTNLRRLQKTRFLLVPGRSSLFLIQCSVVADPGDTLQDVRKRFDAMSPLFDLITSTCVVEDKWTSRASRDRGPAPASPPGQ
jgi:hypothetical protein